MKVALLFSCKIMKIVKEKNKSLDDFFSPDISYRTVLVSVAWHMSSGEYDF